MISALLRRGFFFAIFVMPDSLLHATLATGAAQLIGSTDDGRLKVDAQFNNTSSDVFGRLRTSPIANIVKQALFAMQLERNSFTSTPLVIAIALSCNTNTTTAYASIDWEEVTR